MTLILRVDPIGPNGAKASGYIDVWPADDTLTGTGFFYQQIQTLHFTVSDVLAYQDLTLDASDVSGLTTTPLRYYVRERLDHTERAPAPYVIQVLTANGSPQRLSDLRAQALSAPAIALTPGYLTEITSTDNSVTITPSGTQRDLSVPAVDLSGYALDADLLAEAGTRAADDTTLAGLITAEATTRASADSTHAALTTTAHGGLVASTDSRLTDARTPTGAAGGDLTGTYPNPTLGTSGVTPGSYTNLNATIDAKGRVTAASNGTGGGGSGTVTSVDLTMPSDLTVSGNPITGAGTLAVTANTQAANLVKAGPGSGAAAAPTYRALVAADLPATAVTPGTYTAATVTFDAAGRATGANSNTILSASSDNLFTQQQTITKSNGNSTTGVGTVAVFAGTANVNPAANSGTKFQCKLKSNPTDGRLLAEVRWVWVTPTDASRVAKFVIATNTAGSDTQADRLQLSAAGADLLTSPLTFGTSSTPPAPASGSVSFWWDGTNWKWIKSDGSTGTIF